ncbi:MAG TPA: MaoC family dehydratase [Rhizomicrobium sp.]
MTVQDNHNAADPRDLVGKDVGVSEWFAIDQARIDLFSQATSDPDPMHIDPAWCEKNSPYRHTIAFGFLTISLLTHMARQAIPWSDGEYGMNYGFEKLRLISPVPVNARIRARFRLLSIEQRQVGRLYRFEVAVEIENQDKPAMAAEWLVLGARDSASLGSKPAVQAS